MRHTQPRRPPDDITFAAIDRIAAEPVKCLMLFETFRFPGGLSCYECGAEEVAGIHFVRHRSLPGITTCGACRRQFSITSGTAMRRTRLPLRQGLRAIRLISPSSKGVSKPSSGGPSGALRPGIG